MFFGDFTQAGTDTEGRMAIGGNANLSSYSVGLRLSSSAARYDLIVGKTLTFNSGSVTSGSVAYGTASTITNASVFGNVVKTTPLDFTALQSNSLTQAQAMSDLSTNGATSVQYWGGSTAGITMTGSNSTLNVFRISTTDLGHANSLTITAPSGSTVVINVDGTTASMSNFGISLSGVANANVIFNFPTATTLYMSGIGVPGSIFAPKAAVNFQSGQLNGSIVGANLTGNGQFNYAPFTGCVPTGL